MVASQRLVRLWRKCERVKMPCAYILYSEKHDRFYVGSARAENAETRLKEHNWGKTKSTKGYRPWLIVYQESFLTYTEARKRENFLKSGQGRKWIKEEWQSGRMRRS